MPIDSPGALTFDRDWTNRSDFPTVETDENQVRYDMQYLHNAVKDYLNNAVLTAINALIDAVDDVTAGTVPDGSITTVKLDHTTNSEAVDTGAIQNYAVTALKLAADAVTRSKILDGEVVHDKLSTNPAAVWENNIKDGEVSAYKLKQTPGSEAVVTDAIRDGAITLDKMDEDSVDTDQLCDEAVTLDKMAEDSVDTDQLCDEAVTTAKLDHTEFSEAVDTGAIRRKAVTTEKIDDLAVDHDQLAYDAVDNDNIRDDAVHENNILDAAVTMAKLANFKAFTVAANADIELDTTENARGVLYMMIHNAKAAILSIAANQSNSVSFGILGDTESSTSWQAQGTTGHIEISTPLSSNVRYCLLIVYSGTITPTAGSFTPIT